MLCVPFAMLIAAHAKFLGASLHAAAHHQPVPRLKNVQGAGDSRVGHRANKYGDVLSKTAKEEIEARRHRRHDNEKINQKCRFCDVFLRGAYLDSSAISASWTCFLSANCEGKSRFMMS